MTADETSWKSKAAAKFAAVRAKIPKEWRLSSEYPLCDETSDASVLDVPARCGILSPAELAITENYTAVSLARAAQSGVLKSKNIATAFCKRAAIATQLTNCCTETMFDDALKRGEYLDSYLADHKKPVGPLHGVPVSLKDSFHYPGVQSSIGFASFLDRPEDKDTAALAQMLLELGAILYCKTNIPQTLMTGDSHNYVFGRTLNPHKLKLGAGGSSGGEGSLVAFRGSILGVGTDIGGSIRIPALCNGTYGFKPSSNRTPYGGQTAPVKIGSPGFPPVAGPLANSFEDLHLFMKHVIEAKPWDKDFLALPIPWRSSAAESQFTNMRIGYLLEDTEYPVHPPVRRTLEQSAKKLAAAGFQIVPIKEFPSLQTAIDLACDCYSLDNTKTWKRFISDSGKPMIPSLARTEWAINKKEEYTLDEVFDLNYAWGGYKAAWQKVWTENKLDVILCPPAENTAVLHDDYGIPGYTMLWNLLEVRGSCLRSSENADRWQCPGVIIPVGKADREVDRDDLADPKMKRACKIERNVRSTYTKLISWQIEPKTSTARRPASSWLRGPTRTRS